MSVTDNTGDEGTQGKETTVTEQEEQLKKDEEADDLLNKPLPETKPSHSLRKNKAFSTRKGSDLLLQGRTILINPV